MSIQEKILSYIDECREEQLRLLTALARIPAPSGQEALRAEFCKKWLLENGAEAVTVDEALNVIVPVGVTEDCPLVVFAAHSDVVFPDTEPLPLRMEEDTVHCPGVGDDTACVTALLMAAKFLLREGLRPKDWGLLLVIDSGEEGLGNLKGIRKIFRDYGHRIREFIALDGQTGRCVDKAVGSRRFRIGIDTEGGHSYSAFGNRNAIACLAEMIGELYKVEVPPIGKTTYNIGTVSGGTSVNTIAQHAEMLYEFRSDEGEGLRVMQAHLDRIVGAFREKGLEVRVTSVGDRPCGKAVDEARMEALRARAAEATRLCHDRELLFTSGSTDCNIPLSMGIPAVCVGCYEGAGSHTREEYIRTGSLGPGLRFALEMMTYYL